MSPAGKQKKKLYFIFLEGKKVGGGGVGRRGMTGFTSKIHKLMYFIKECFLFLCILSPGNNSEISELPARFGFGFLYFGGGGRALGGLLNYPDPQLPGRPPGAVPARWSHSPAQRGQPGPTGNRPAAAAGGCGRNAGAWELLSTARAENRLTLPTGTTSALKCFPGSVPISTLIVFK